MGMPRLLLSALAVVVLAVAVPVGPASAQQRYPVTYHFLSSAIAAGATDPFGSPPGANDWHCSPSAAHPEPVVLVHGLLRQPHDELADLRAAAEEQRLLRLRAHLRTVAQRTRAVQERVRRLRAHDGAQCAPARRLRRAVLKQTGAHKVDIVGHSEGTQMPDYYAKFLGGARFIDKYVSLAPLWHGTNAAGQATLYALAQDVRLQGHDGSAVRCVLRRRSRDAAGSAFFKKLRSGGTPAVPGINYTNIVTEHDELVSPYTSGIQSGMTQLRRAEALRAGLHRALRDRRRPDRRAHRAERARPGAPHAVPCELVLPFEGPPGN